MIALVVSVLVFASDREGVSQIYSIREDGRGLKRVTKTVREEREPRVSPDGRWIVFTSTGSDGSDLFRVPRAGGKPERLTKLGAASEAAWAPDGKSLAFVVRTKRGSRICVLRLADGVQTTLSPVTAQDRSPAWSPDGTQLAFSSVRDGDEDVWVMAKDGRERRRLTTRRGEDSRPSWSPDGKTIVYNSTAGTRGDEIVTMRFDGTGRTTLVRREDLARKYVDRNVASWGPRVSPDGTRIVFTSVRSGNAEVYSRRIDGTETRRITRDPGQDFDPDWLPRG